MRVQYPKSAYGPYCELDPNKNGVYIFKEVSFFNSTTLWVSLLVDQWVPEGIFSSVLRSTSVICSVLRASKFSELRLIEMVILRVITPSVLASACCYTFWEQLFNYWKYFVWLRNTDESSVPEVRIWSILQLDSYKNGVYMYIWVEVSFYISTTWWVSRLVDQ